MAYDNEISNSLKKGIFTNAEIYSFIETPNEQQFESFYNFCRGNLNINSDRYSLGPNVIIFLNDFSVNAKAGVRNNYYVIAFNSGLIVWSIQNILMNEGYHNFINEKFPETLKYYDNSLDVLSFQLSTQFTYYHELAHLIQFSNNNEAETLISERMIYEVNYDLTLHWLEMNADTFASISISSHIQQYLFKQIANELNPKTANDSLIIFGTSLLTYLMSFASTSEELYFFERSHPHPIIRFINILMTTIHYLNQSPKFAELKINFSYTEIFQQVLSLYISLEKNKTLTTSISKHLNQSLERIPEIIAYNKTIREFKSEHYKDSVEEWNKIIT